MSDLAKLDFMHEEVRKHAIYLREQLVNNFRRKGIVASGQTVNSFVCRALGGNGDRDEIQVLFPDQGRFSDMGAGRAYKLGQYVGRDARTEEHKGRKGHKQYSRTAFGTQSTLLNILANGFIEHTQRELKNTLNTDGR